MKCLRAGRCGHRPLRNRIMGCVGEGLCPSRGRGNRRSAAGGRRSEAVSRKCPDWRPQQWPGIGWHDGGQENPAPTKGLQEVRWAVDHKGRPYDVVPIELRRVYPIPFLHISCSLCVDSLWINFPSPFLPPSCGNSSFPLWTKNPCISRPYGGFPQKFSLRLLLLKNT